MQTYEYSKIQDLFDSLAAHHVDEAVIAKIMQGGEAIRKGDSPKRKGEWLLGAMQRMEQLLSDEVVTSVREGCACCLSGKRLALSKRSFKQNDTLEARVAAINSEKMVCGHSVKMVSDSEFIVRFQPEEWQSYRCVCLPKVDGAPSDTYCRCCGGHIKHHMQVALGMELTCKIVHTALTSYGKEACVFRLTRA